MSVTVLTHFYNEEVLLPFWLRHHREIFDHGVLVDRGSTDRSLEIIAELVPDWEVVTSRNPLFDARDTDMEMMGLERRYGGWKIILNVPELLVHDDLRGHLRELERSSPQTRTLAVGMRMMLDPPHEQGTPLDDRPLFEQRHHGTRQSSTKRHYLRFLHRESHGDYGAGRHFVPRPYTMDDELVIFKYAWSPWPQVRPRKMQISEGIPDADVRLGMSWGLFYTVDELDLEFEGISPMAVDLSSEPHIAALLHRLRDGYPSCRPEPVPRLEPDPRRRVGIVGNAALTRAIGAALDGEHDVRVCAAESDAGVGWADVVVVDHTGWPSPHPAWPHNPVVIDVTGCDPSDADETMLIRGDFFLWDAERADAWIARFVEAGRTAGEDDENLPLLGACVVPGAPAADVAERLATFLRAPRRTTALVAADEPFPVSRLAYFARANAAVRSVLVTADQVRAAYEENARLRDEYTRLQEEQARWLDEFARMGEQQALLRDEYTRLQEAHERVHGELVSLHEEYARLREAHTQVHAELVRLHEEYAELRAAIPDPAA
jgi:hypothetical protein